MIAVLTAHKHTFNMWQYYMDASERKNYHFVNSINHVRGITFTGMMKLNDWRNVDDREVIIKFIQSRIKDG